MEELKIKLQALSEAPSFAKRAKIALLILVGMALVYYYLDGFESTDNAFLESNVVSISTKVPGYVTNVYVNDNQSVKKGDLLLEIDPEDYALKVQIAEASLEAIKARYSNEASKFESALVSIPSNYESAKAQYESSAANLEKAQADLRRLQAQNELTRTQKDLDYAVAAFKTAQSQLEDAKAKMKSANTVDIAISAQKSQVDELKAEMKQAEASLKQAQDDLTDTKVVAPYDGKIAKKTVEVGSYAQTGQTLLSLVGNEFWVVANFKETQLARIKPGYTATIAIDAFPNVKLKGVVESIQSGTGSRLSLFPAENALGNYVKVVQRIPVKITLDPEEYKDLPLAVGMSVVPKVKVR